MVWSYIKNVSFEYFKDIKHTHNEQPIVNMWNGMHFPWDKGREVVEIYVKKAHFTNVICWRGDRPYDPYKDVTHPAQLDPRLKTKPNDMTIMKHAIKERQMIEGGHVGMDAPSSPTHFPTPHGGSHGMMSGNWRQQSPGWWDSDPTPTVQNRQGILSGNVDATPPHFDGSASPSPQPGDMVSFIVDKQGNYIPVTPTHQPAGRLQIPGSNTTHLPPPQTFQAYSQQLCGPQQASFYNAYGRGGYSGSPRRGQGGRGGGSGHLRGAHSFINNDNARMHQSGFGRGIPSPMRGAHSFHNAGMGHVQQPTAGPMSPTVQRMRSEVGISQHSGIPGNLRGAPSMMNIAPNPTRAQAPQYSTNVLREAVSKPNLFVPMGATSPHPRATSFKPSTPGIHDACAGAVYGPVPAVVDTLSHFPGTRHTTAPEDFASGLKALGGYPVYPTPTDVAAADGDSVSARKEKRLDDLSKIMIHIQGEVSLIRHEHDEQMKKQNVGTESWRKADFDSPDFNADASSSQWDVYEMGSGTTLERRCVSPVHGSDGDILDSASKHDSPNTKAARRKLNHLERYFYGQGSDSSRYGRMKADVDNLVNSPPESVANENKEDDEVGGGVSLE